MDLQTRVGACDISYRAIKAGYRHFSPIEPISHDRRTDLGLLPDTSHSAECGDL